MILFLTQSYYSNCDFVIRCYNKMGIRLFRFNTDLFEHYQFIWENDSFGITDPTGRKISSDEIEGIAIYKASLMIDQFGLEREKVAIRKWIRSNLNLVTCAIARWGIERKLLRLFTPYELLYPKMFQMQLAKEFFPVPRASLHWGMRLDHREVIVKTLSGRPISENTWFYAQKVDQHDLAPRYPWLTQDIAPGDRDATVVYINGAVHCYQFCTPRGKLTDWRVTQGTKKNRWEKWDAGEEFMHRVDLFMKKMKLKYGRLDFIIGAEEPQFLEVNPCGQFGWLDDKQKTLHREIAEAILDPSTAITL